MSPLVLSILQFAMGLLAAATAMLIGWVWRGSVEHRRAREREERRRARVEARRSVSRPGTSPARVRTARLDRGREMQEEN